jgi:trigger factor
MAGLERRMTIVVPSETFEQQIVDRLKEAQKRVRIDGFRPGRVPLREVHRRFGKSVRQEVAGELMQSSFFEALRNESMSPAGPPNLEVLKMDPGIDFEFTATFEVVPSVTLASFEDVQATKPVASVTEEDVDRMAENLRQQRRTFEPVVRAAAEGDRVKVNFTGRIDGEVFEGGTGKDVTFVVGADQMIEAFDRGVRGALPGASVEFDASFPDDYRAEALRGKTAHFNVDVIEVAEPRLPELDDAFFESFGVADGTRESFRSEIRENMQRELDAAIQARIKQQVLNELHRIHDVQMPASMVAAEITAQKQQMAERMRDYARGGTLPDMPDDLFRAQAERRVKLSLVLNAIIEQRGLTADGARVRARIEQIAKPYAQPEQVVAWYYSQERELRQIELSVLEDQAVEHVLASARVTEEPSDYQTVIRGAVQADRGHDHDHAHDHDHHGHDHSHDHDHDHAHDHDHDHDRHDHAGHRHD